MDLAKHFSEIPAFFNGKNHSREHDHHRQQEVGYSQREGQIVGRCVELLEVSDGHDYKEVSQQCEDHSRPKAKVEGDADSNGVDRPQTRAIPVAELRLHRPEREGECWGETWFLLIRVIVSATCESS